MRKYFFLSTSFFLTFLIISCNNEISSESKESVQKLKPNFSHQLVEKGQKEIYIDQTTRNWTSRMELFEENQKEYLVYENKQNSSLQIYDLNSGTLEFKTPLYTSGPNSVKCLMGFHIASLDSIYTFCNYSYEVFLINRKGEVLDKYGWLEEFKNTNEPFSRIKNFTGNKVIFQNGSFFIPAIYSGTYDDPTVFKRYGTLQKIDLKQRKTTFHFPYSDLYTEKNFFHLSNNTWKCQMPNKNFLLGFPADEYVIETDLHNVSKKHYAGSHYFTPPTPIPVNHTSTTPELMDKYSSKTSSFRSLQYDPYRKVYYRVMIGEVDGNLSMREAHKKPVNIIVLDENLKIIGEKVLGKNKFLYRNILVSKDGLLVSNANPENPEIEEDKIVFTVFDIEKI